MVQPTLLHQLYTQVILSRKVMTEPIALELYKRCTLAVKDFDADFVVTHRASPGGLVSFLVEINDLLAPLNFEVRRGGFEVVEGVPARRRGGGRDGDALEDAQHEATVWALVNRSQEGVMSLASDLSGVEVAYFKAMVENIFESYPANSIGSNRALAISGELATKMTKKQAEMVLTALVARGWLNKSKRGRYTLAQRAILELEPFLKAEYEDSSLFYCAFAACGRLVLQGWKCENEGCDAHIHDTCRATLLAARKVNCPTCRKPWIRTDDVPGVGPSALGEASVPVREDKFEGASKRRRGGRAGAADGEGGEEGEEGDEGSQEDDFDTGLGDEPPAKRPRAPTQNGRASRSSNGKGKGKAPVSVAGGGVVTESSDESEG